MQGPRFQKLKAMHGLGPQIVQSFDLPATDHWDLPYQIASTEPDQSALFLVHEVISTTPVCLNGSLFQRLPLQIQDIPAHPSETYAKALPELSASFRSRGPSKLLYPQDFSYHESDDLEYCSDDDLYDSISYGPSIIWTSLSGQEALTPWSKGSNLKKQVDQVVNTFDVVGSTNGDNQQAMPSSSGLQPCATPCLSDIEPFSYDFAQKESHEAISDRSCADQTVSRTIEPRARFEFGSNSPIVQWSPLLRLGWYKSSGKRHVVLLEEKEEIEKLPLDRGSQASVRNPKETL